MKINAAARLSASAASLLTKQQIKAASRLTAADFGDVPPKTGNHGDIDVTFTTFCQAVRKFLGSEVSGISGSKNQEWLWVYVSKIEAKQIPALDKLLKAAQIPGNPRFDSINLAANSSYHGLLVIKYRIY